ncbi:competence protein ComFA [Anoxybacillus voinovskiensis]|uniref:Competence protein ComFA n=1 Tax=Anoxybacteroides voinovskiense TaxID=230470 RepID=A0A840DW71_9BACL|nr:DEAD/DEAH box helicase [Anoxybacillus voinovskiensis]MBB4073769.1 competence protein ComFA [Anoxybacillus voinovskiensis]GGJ64064.1 DNA/RNA helicase [Anoxybacillus voinovskiensis]
MRFMYDGTNLVPEPLTAGGEKVVPISRVATIPIYELNPHFSPSSELLSFLAGRQLLLDELSFSLDQLHAHYENGYVSYQKGVVPTEQGHRCMRCGNDAPHFFASFFCARCETVCTYCRKCVTMGRVSECTPLVVSNVPPERVVYPHPLAWTGTLSKAQQRAADAVVQAIERRAELLVWAVCGAGKTEVLFPSIQRALELGDRVCLATPRTDVVLELAPRLKQAFPSVSTIALYGGSEDRKKEASLVITTTHQLLRFYRAFDVMIIDEVDAFPYSVEPMLAYAAEKARTKPSALIYLTATPNENWQREMKQGKRSAVTIPARYHGYPLPVPTFAWCGNWRKKVNRGTLPTNVLAWVEKRLQEKKQAFLFVPHVELLEKVAAILQRFDRRIVGVHAEDKARKEKVQSFRDGNIPLLVTTTILERGVTVPNIDVAVLGAEDDVFTEGALVQIAGRVGRSAQYPGGDVRFFHFGKTKAMVKAKRHICDMNDEARKRGLLW